MTNTEYYGSNEPALMSHSERADHVEEKSYLCNNTEIFREEQWMDGELTQTGKEVSRFANETADEVFLTILTVQSVAVSMNQITKYL